MRLKIDGKEFCVSILPDDKGYKVRVGKRQIATSHSSPVFKAGNKKYTARLHKKADSTYNISIDGDNYTVEMVETDHCSSRFVKAPMQGTIVALDITKGQEVKKGQTLLRLISMKMENEIRAEADCKVKDIKARNKQQVAKGDVLIEFE